LRLSLLKQGILGILLGFSAARGVADFLVRFASRRVGAFRKLFFMQLLALAGSCR
jgi:hypothetical protein